MDEPLIVAVIRRYHPGWEPPADNGKLWQPCLCPFHGEERASAAVSYEYQAFRCMACSAKGNALTLIKEQEGVTYQQAQLIAEGISEGGSGPIQPSTTRVSRRRVFGEPRAHGPVDPGHRRRVPTRVRRRTFGGS